MTETKVTKTLYATQYKREGEDWKDSEWTTGGIYRLEEALSLLHQARETNNKTVALGFKHREYRLVKRTYFVTTEIVEES
tara:strand:+ start:230 stop:469 length:240 start_codon:yes stop_codon:yes gene_type:complete